MGTRGSEHSEKCNCPKCIWKRFKGSDPAPK